MPDLSEYFPYSLALALLVTVTVVLTLSQVVRTYQGLEVEIHKVPATYGLYVINLTIAAVALTAYWRLSPAPSWSAGPLWAFGLPALTQSRFSLGRAMNDGQWDTPDLGSLSFELTFLHEVYAKLFRREMDAAINAIYDDLLPAVRCRYKTLADLVAATHAAVEGRSEPYDEKEEQHEYVEALAKGELRRRDRGHRRRAHREVLTETARYAYLTRVMVEVSGMAYVRRQLGDCLKGRTPSDPRFDGDEWVGG